MIIMMQGLPGTGKSFVADKLAKAIPNAVVLKTVSFRPVHDSGAELFDEENPQTKADKDASYHVLCEQAGKVLKAGKIPILDATFHKKYRREWVYDLAEDLNEKLAIISVYCDEKVIFERLNSRQNDVSMDAFLKTKEAYEIMKRQMDALNEKANVMNINTTQDIEIKEILTWLKNISL